jgi:GH35 family endo-1,4-beta-xylanase
MTWANLVRKWVGYENQEVQLSTNNSQEEIIDQWLMVDISQDQNETTLVDILDEPLPTEEQLARRKLWKKRLEKASKSSSSPTLPPRARVLKKTPNYISNSKTNNSC